MEELLEPENDSERKESEDDRGECDVEDEDHILQNFRKERHYQIEQQPHNQYYDGAEHIQSSHVNAQNQLGLLLGEVEEIRDTKCQIVFVVQANHCRYNEHK